MTKEERIIKWQTEIRLDTEALELAKNECNYYRELIEKLTKLKLDAECRIANYNASILYNTIAIKRWSNDDAEA